uniref:PH domain-containing protein n=1 Tax=Manihot esculenta TaxID=3983 RepID=A0A2C9WHU7_MANES
MKNQGFYFIFYSLPFPLLVIFNFKKQAIQYVLFLVIVYRLEHVDEILRSARFSGYLYIRTRWTALPGEPPPIDDTDVDDWLPRFVVLHGPCIFYYLLCTDLSPQDSTLLSDIVEVGSLPSFTREDDETRYSFYILTRHGLRYECSSISKIQVDAWLAALKTECKSGSDALSEI